MAFFDCHVFSHSLALQTAVHVVMPDDHPPDGGFPVLFLLHGLSDDHTTWTRRTSIERYACERGLAVVMPAVGRSFYQDMAAGPAMWTWLSQELPQLMRRYFPIAEDRSRRFSAGLSMGGYGALRLALAHPRSFAAAASLSGALDFPGRLRNAGKTGSRISLREWEAIAGTGLPYSAESDLTHLARAAAPLATRPALWLSCGTEDDLLPDTRNFRAALDAMGYPNTYEETPGGHDWAYWDAAIQRVLNWLPI